MKKIYCLLFVLLPLMAFAGKVKVTKPVLTLENDTLKLEFAFDVEEVKVNSVQSYAFTPVLFFEKNRQSLPPVVISGMKNFKMRAKDRRIAKQGNYNAPYTVVEGRSADRQDRIDYIMYIPYQEWMRKADMWILQEGEKDCLIDLPQIKVIEPVVIEEEPLPQKGVVCEPCMSMVSYLIPTEEPLKVRSEQNTLYIEYAVGGTEFNAEYKNNAAELQKLRETLSPLTQGDLVTFKAINICGYASPDGSAKTNDRIANKRASSFALHLKGSYNFNESLLKVSSAGEDWDSLIKMLEKEQPAYAEKALEIINKNTTNLDLREARLKTGLGAATYRVMMNAYYPRLRRLSITVDYEIREVRNAEAAQLIYTNPKMLNQQEMYGVAKTLQPGTKEYRDVYEIAATNYPGDVVANINAASANIVYGDFDRASKYLERVKDDSRAWNNLGVLAWLSGDTDMAKEWFTKALAIEPAKAQENLDKMK